MELRDLTEIAGGAGIAFYVMWLWLKSVKKELEDCRQDLKKERDDRISEIKELIPLVNDSSRCIQELASKTKEDNTVIVDSIKKLFEENKCKGNAESKNNSA